VTQIRTTIGTADVLHRLALGVEVVDAVNARLVGPGVRVGREVPAIARPPAARLGPAWPCLDFEPRGTGRFCLRHARALPTRPLTVRVDDPTRRYVPRRFTIPLWTLAAVEAADADPPAGPFVRPRARLLRPWLLPGSAYPLPRGVTALRGRVVRRHVPVRWPRVVAIDAMNTVLGRAHGDERGEFLLVVTDTGTLPPPAPSELDLELLVFAGDPAHPVAVDDEDRCADLVVEPVARSSNPPLPAELDNDLLRGRSRPPAYVPSAAARPQLTVAVGSSLTLTADVEFDT
jgi:hypothetical protein